jgi:hypothetical protein
MAFEIINPISYLGWDDLLLKTPGSSFFHSSHWTRVLNESYGYKPLYFSEINGNRSMTLISMMEVRSVLTGKRGVSLPFTDYCELMISDKEGTQAALDRLIEYGKKAGWKSIEMRSGNTLPEDIPFSSYYYGHTLDLLQGEEQVFSNLRASTGRNIKKAIKYGVSVNLYQSLESLEHFYRLNCITRRKHGIPPQPFNFFKKIFEHIISQDRGIIVLATHNKKVIAGAVYFHLGKKAIYKYGASDKHYQHLRANNLVMWEAIRWYAQNGFCELCFGRTEPENVGLLQFKRGWGAKERIIRYYKYDLVEDFFTTDNRTVTPFYNKIFSKMPIPLLNVFGSVFYKHVG